MTEEAGRLEVAGETLAFRRIAGRGPTVVWLGGYRSDMTGTKAQALADWARGSGRAFLRFDFAGHGESTGTFDGMTLTRWREDSIAMVDALTDGPLVLVGSSMGGWVATLLVLTRPERLHALVLIAPAPDFTSALVEPALSDAERAALARDGVVETADGDRYSRALLEDGARWTLLPGPVEVSAPVRILQGGQDEAVPWRHALAFAEAMTDADVVFTLVRDGDHRLSRPQDVSRLIATLEEACGG